MTRAPAPVARRHRRGLIAIALLVALGLIVCWALAYRPVEIAGARASDAPYVFPPPRPGLKLHVFNTGSNRMSSLLVGPNPPWRPVPAFVIEHPSHGLIVFDPGLSDAAAREGERAYPLPMRWLIETRSSPELTLPNQMRRAGLDPARVRIVLISHLHDDHVGSPEAFPQARMMISAGANRTEAAEKIGKAPDYVTFEPSAQVSPFAAFKDLLGDGSITLLSAPGHTSEDMMALLMLESGPVLLTGDAIVHFDWLASDDVQRIPVSPEQAAAVRNQVRKFRQMWPGATVFPGHDLRIAPRNAGDLIIHSPGVALP